jgi:hypothetical protein
VFTDEEEVMATRISDGGELGRRTDGGGQGATLFGEEERVPGTGEARISIERERERRKKARNNFTDGVFSGGDEEAEEVARGECGGSGGQGRMKVLCKCKGEGENSSSILSRDRERGERKRKGTAADGLAIDGRRALRVVGTRSGRAIEGGEGHED